MKKLSLLLLVCLSLLGLFACTSKKQPTKN